MMVGVPQELESYISDFEGFQKNRAVKGPAWVGQIRQTAISRFAALGFPTSQHEDVNLREEWRYTNVAPLVKVHFRPAADERNGLTADTCAQVAFAGWACTQLVFVNGCYARELSLLGRLPEGVKAGSLATVLNTEPALVEPHLSRYANYQGHPFVALNTAFMADGAFVYIPRGTVIQKPIHLLFVSTTGENPTVSHPRNLIVADDDSQATIVESYVGLENDVYFSNVVTEIRGGENAIIAHYRLQQESREAFHIATLHAHLRRRSNFSSHSISLGGALVRSDVTAVLAGEGSECTLNGLYMVTGQQQVDNHTRIDHEKPHCSSRELYKGILDGKSKGIFNGKIYVHKAAQKTDAKQTNKNLLLSEDAVINTKPQLEIYADDVKCTHGSTIGQLDHDAMFYLRSRGIGLQAARRLLRYAFASELIGQLKIEPVRAQLDNLLTTRL
jgi:Fe-S cluster assembly protein SufD